MHAIDAACPICGADRTAPLLHRPAVPVHQNLLFPTAAAARAAARGDLALRACGRCGFVFNTAFDPDLLEYGRDYENSQQHSPAFAEHLDAMVQRIVVECGLTQGRVVEVGCGKGDFLLRLLAHPDSQHEGVGFDPSYLGPSTGADGRATFVATIYDGAAGVDADVMINRHVIEHIPDPAAMLRSMRSAAVTGRTRVFVETPCVEWILRNGVLWDMFYEHCSLFSAHSLGLALTRAGFRVTEVRHVFGGQYLWAEAETGPGQWPPTRREPLTAALDVAELENTRLVRWRDHLAELSAEGPLVLWGAGAKGLTFCNLLDPEQTLLRAVVDVNPAKQGQFIGGSGHPIIAPQDARGARTAIVLNPRYVDEIRDEMSRIDERTVVMDWMEL